MARGGAVLYFAWAVLHLAVSPNIYAVAAGMAEGVAQGRVYQMGFTIAAASVVIIVAAIFNWRNDRSAYWVNAVVASIVDIAFIIYIFIPGHAPIVSLSGPLLWLPALLLTSMAQARRA